MKHFYNANSAMTVAWPAANALGTAKSSKIILFLLVGFFLLLSGKSMAQVTTLYHSNDFSDRTDFDIQNVNRGSITVTGGELRALTINGTTPGYNGYVVINTHLFKLQAGYTYTVSFQARANNQNNAAVGSVEVLRGASAEEAGSANGILLGLATIAKGLEFSNYSVTFTASNALNNQFIALRLTSAQEQNTHLYLDNLSITETCVPQAPQVAPVSSCTAASFTLTVLNAETNTSYRWYKADGVTVINGQNTSSYSTGMLTETTNFFVSRINGQCESEKELITALIGKANAPSVNSTENCPSNDVILIASGAGTGDSYRWYDVAEGGTPINYTNTISRKRANEHGYVYATIIKADGCESDRVPVYIMKNSETPTVPTAESVSRCGSGKVNLTASGAVEGESYLWYTNPTGGTAIASGAKFTTPILPEGASITYYVSKLNIALGCESLSRTAVTATAISRIAATGEIVEPTNPVVGQPATFSFTSNIPASEVESYQWYYHEVGSSENTWVTSANTRDLIIEKMPGNIDGVRVELVIRAQNAACYSNVNATTRIFPIDNTKITPLPVELVSFKAQRHAQGVNLTWMTASELDNSGFEVQVSTDAKTFQKIGFVKSEVGTTSIAQHYSFLDKKAVAGTRYYRLAQVDLDGTTTYSAIKVIALNGGNGEAAAYPNPFEDVVTVKLNGTEARKVLVTLTNALGKVILHQQEETAGNTISVDMSQVITKGMYMLHVVDNGAKHTFKLMKR